MTARSTRFPTFVALGRRLSSIESKASGSLAERRIGQRLDGWLRKPPGRLFIGTCTILFLAATYSASFPGANGIEFFLAIAVGGQALGIAWAVRLVFALALTRRAFLTRRSLLWAVPPALILMAAANMVTHAPMWARFQMSQDAMDSFAADVIDGSFETRSFVGLWPVERAKRVGDTEMRFLVRGATFLDEYGFAYSTEGRPKRIGEDNFVHLEGPWYMWEKSW